MAEFEPAKIPSASEILRLIRDPEGQLSRLEPLVIPAQQFEGYLKPVETIKFWKTFFPQEAIESYVSTQGDSVLKLSRKGEPISNYFIFDADQEYDHDFNLAASNVVLVSDELAISLASLAPLPRWTFDLDLYPEDGYQDWISKWGSSYPIRRTTMGSIFNNLGINAILHELGHAWSDHLKIDPDSDLQHRLRSIAPGMDSYDAGIELAGVREVNFSERVANVLARVLSYRLINSGFTIGGIPFAMDNSDNQYGLETYDEEVFGFVVTNANHPPEYFASRKYRTGSYRPSGTDPEGL